jgi:hypothetical protein
LAVTYNVSSLSGKLYVNGNQTVSTSGLGQVENVTRVNNYFGHSNFAKYGDVMFDEIKFHGRALSALEIWNDKLNNQSYISFV